MDVEKLGKPDPSRDCRNCMAAVPTKDGGHQCLPGKFPRAKPAWRVMRMGPAKDRAYVIPPGHHNLAWWCVNFTPRLG